MTDREKAIVMAHTGICMLAGDKFQIFHRYVEDILGRPVQTIEMGMESVADEIKEKSREDFITLCREDQEPCEDVIRREDALQALCNAVHKNDDTIPCSNQIVSCLWSKTKVQDYAREIYKLPSINSQPKTGHWVYRIYGGFHEQGDWYCSHCDYQFNYGNGHAKYCPECGYEMSEPSTEEVIGDKDYDWIIKR